MLEEDLDFIVTVNNTKTGAVDGFLHNNANGWAVGALFVPPFTFTTLDDAVQAVGEYLTENASSCTFLLTHHFRVTARSPE